MFLFLHLNPSSVESICTLVLSHHKTDLVLCWKVRAGDCCLTYSGCKSDNPSICRSKGGASCGFSRPLSALFWPMERVESVAEPVCERNPSDWLSCSSYQFRRRAPCPCRCIHDLTLSAWFPIVIFSFGWKSEGPNVGRFSASWGQVNVCTRTVTWFKKLSRESPLCVGIIYGSTEGQGLRGAFRGTS